MMKNFQFCLLAIFALGVTGCSSVEYYWQAIDGHVDILNSEQPIEQLLQEPDLDPELRGYLEEFQQARDFAIVELGLPDNDSYRNYADVQRDYVIWNVIATKEFSVTPQQWCFPFAGCVSYRGYFNKADAQEFAEKLRNEGMDTYVAGARAYSTLGWFDDPLLNTMLYRDEALRVGVIFHELAHQQLYVQDDTAFNEAFAMVVAQEGVRRWFLNRKDEQAYEAFLQSEKRRAEFNSLLKQTREKLDRLYSKNLKPDLMRKDKAAIFQQLKQEYRGLKKSWNNDDRYDTWMKQSLNNAHLALVATYHELVPSLKAYLYKVDGDLPNFYQQMEQLGSLPKAERHQKLAMLDSE